MKTQREARPIFCTIAASNYLAQAYHLAATLRIHHPDAPVILCLIERDVPKSLLNDGPFTEVVQGHDVIGEDWERFAFRHFVLECATAVKASLMARILMTHPANDTVVYLDPDVAVYSPLEELGSLLNDQSVAVTPHHLVDVSPEHLFPLLHYGLYNLGFIAVRRSPEGEAFLRWWDSKLRVLCYKDPPRGLFVDQKWIDVAVSLFPIARITVPGFNVGYWNIGQRRITGTQTTPTLAGGPVRFIHFSGAMAGTDLGHLIRAVEDSDSLIFRLREDYREEVLRLRRVVGEGGQWSYDSYLSGEGVATELRMAVRTNGRLLRGCANPFLHSNEYFFRRSAVPTRLATA